MEVKTCVFTVILLLTLWFELYKIPLTSVAPYFIFPWSEQGQLSKTDPVSLNHHVITALLLVCASYVRYLFPKSPIVFQIHALLHLAFSVILVPMLGNFGDAPRFVALAINGELLFTLFMAFVQCTPDVYFTVLTIPILFEITLYIKQNVIPELLLILSILKYLALGY